MVSFTPRPLYFQGNGGSDKRILQRNMIRQENVTVVSFLGGCDGYHRFVSQSCQQSLKTELHFFIPAYNGEIP
jgi:hypothetical protein